MWFKKKLTALEKQTIDEINELTEIASARKENFKLMQSPITIEFSELLILNNFKINKEKKMGLTSYTVVFDVDTFMRAYESFCTVKSCAVEMCTIFIQELTDAKNNIINIKDPKKVMSALENKLTFLKNTITKLQYRLQDASNNLNDCEDYYTELKKIKTKMIGKDNKFSKLMIELKILVGQGEQIIREFTNTTITLNTSLQKFKNKINALIQQNTK